MRNFPEFYLRKQKEWGPKFDPSDLLAVAGSIRNAYETERRIRLSRDNGVTYADGYVGVTTGWRPCFILVYNRRSMGGSYVINGDDRIVKVFETRR